ncbi:MAG: glycosyltransferase family 4 protein [Nitrososphaerota archaeon]|nr:glycosyltransferase family 4 protein [Nitrososphaerota archaeon]MDG7011038.1 glycosyltransferase family 4 protein [Nitrososphaerota archaeon]
MSQALGRLRCLLVSPADPLTGSPRAGPLRRFIYPPPGVEYTHVTDRVSIPAGKGQYTFSPVNVGLAAVKFALEHAFPLEVGRAQVVHTFFWDVRKFTVPWVHESDQSLGQYLTGYNNVGGFVKRAITEGYSSYLNSRGCAGVVTWTRWARKGFEEDGVDPGRVAVIPPPFETVSASLPHGGCNVLFLGRDFLRKGGDVVLRAFGSIRDPGCRLTYVGRADGRALREIGGDRRVSYLERPSKRILEEEVWPYVDVLALPTRADAFAMTVAEAMSRGIPVVTSSIPSIAEVVEDGVSGYLVPVGDATKFAERLARLVGDPSLRSRLGRGGQERARTLFSPQTVGRQLMEAYRRAA